MTRILLGQLGSNGDCLYATAIARQIKHDFPGCHLTWAISPLCKAVIKNNPDVDAIWEVEAGDWTRVFGDGWYAFEAESLQRLTRGEFDKIFLTQIAPANFRNYDGTVRASL
jgi:ADP-heptose:LPS heptosyltransferase